MLALVAIGVVARSRKNECPTELEKQKARLSPGYFAFLWLPGPSPAFILRSIAKRCVSKDGMAQMSAKFKEMGSSVYLDTEKVKASNRVL